MAARYAPLMLGGVLDAWLDVMRRGGLAMWPLLALSILAVALLLERGFFYLSQNTPGRRARAARLARLLRRGDRDGARRLADAGGGLYCDTVTRLLDEPPSEAAAVEAVELQRARLERFLPTVSTIITAAPMLGILGTVLGLIDAFDLLSASSATGGPPNQQQLGGAIGEALISTAAGLMVAMVTLFPYNALRAMLERTLSRLESLAAAGVSPPDPPTQRAHADGA